MSKLLFTIAILWVADQLTYCDEHVYGNSESGEKILFEKQLFARNELKPKNYSIIFKYIASETSPNITFAKFDVSNAISNGSIIVMSEKGKEKTLQTILSIINGTNFKVTATMYGASVNLFDADSLIKSLGEKQTKPKTFTVVYGHNSTRSLNRKINIGHRQHGDKMLAFQSKNVSISSRFAENEFEFQDNQKYITSIGFSFDSPTAIAFVNSTFVKEHGINAIVYDLNSAWFMANMTVYGYDDFDRPNTYKPVIFAQSKPLY